MEQTEGVKRYEFVEDEMKWDLPGTAHSLTRTLLIRFNELPSLIEEFSSKCAACRLERALSSYKVCMRAQEVAWGRQPLPEGGGSLTFSRYVTKTLMKVMPVKSAFPSLLTWDYKKSPPFDAQYTRVLMCVWPKSPIFGA